MLQALWNKIKGYQTYAQTRDRAKGVIRRYEEAQNAVQRFSNLEAESVKDVVNAHAQYLVSKPNTKVRIDPDHVSTYERNLLEAVARYINTRNNLPQALATIKIKADELQPGFDWIKANVGSHELKYNGDKQASLINYIESLEPYIEKLMVACEVERRLLAWLPIQGPESALTRFSDNNAWFYSALEAILPPPLPNQTGKYQEQATVEPKRKNTPEPSDNRAGEYTLPRAPRIKRRPPAEAPTAPMNPPPAEIPAASTPPVPAEPELTPTAHGETVAEVLEVIATHAPAEAPTALVNPPPAEIPAASTPPVPAEPELTPTAHGETVAEVLEVIATHARAEAPAEPVDPPPAETPAASTPPVPAEPELTPTAHVETTAEALEVIATHAHAEAPAEPVDPSPAETPAASTTHGPAEPPSISLADLRESPAISFTEMMDEVRRLTVKHEAVMAHLEMLSGTQKRLSEEIIARNSRWLFEKRLNLMRGIEVEKLEENSAFAFAVEVRKIGLRTAYDLLVAAAKGPLSLGVTASDVQLSRSTGLNHSTAMVAMRAVKKALDESRDTLHLRLDPDKISPDEHLLLEAVARYIKVANDLPGIMEKLNEKLVNFTDFAAQARARTARNSLRFNNSERAELAEYCKRISESLQVLKSDCSEREATLLALPSEGPMEVVRRFSDNSAWFYATLAAVVSPTTSKATVDKRGHPSSGGSTSQWGASSRDADAQLNQRADTENASRSAADDPDKPKLRQPPQRSLAPPDWDEMEDEVDAGRAQDDETLETTFTPLPDSSEDSDHGHVPLEIAQAVEALDLKRGPLKATLRRYQMFGAQFMMQQKRTLLGDDMGLGKTVQALAAMCHLHALGQKLFLVVAPNSVLINWEREVTTHTGLKPFVLHGTQRLAYCAEWSKSGGVGITTYDTAGVLLPHIANIDMLVVDEAHKIKNPKAKRTQRITFAASKAPIVALMSGTALENRLSELHALVCLAQPEIKAAADYLLSSARPSAEEARRRIASAYLRRTQADVLSELPEMTKVDEYVSLSEEEQHTEEAMKPHVQNQRIATTIGMGDGNSAKYDRLKELLEFYRANGDKVVIFSAFRQVLNDVAAICGGCEQITGEVSPSKRMGMIDRLKAKQGFGCLALQVEAGGQGLNIQFARVVILMEPQFKPSTENQAIARVHRMGQGRKVIVHRLIAKDSIDEDLVELIKYKQQIFDAYANQSAVKDESAMSVDSGTVQQQILDELQRRAEERRNRRAASLAQDSEGT